MVISFQINGQKFLTLKGEPAENKRIGREMNNRDRTMAIPIDLIRRIEMKKQKKSLAALEE